MVESKNIHQIPKKFKKKSAFKKKFEHYFNFKQFYLKGFLFIVSSKVSHWFFKSFKEIWREKNKWIHRNSIRKEM